MRSVWRLAWAALAAILLIGPPSSQAETITVGGSGAADELLQRLSNQFTPKTGIRVDIVKSLGSAGSLRAAMEGVLDIAVPGQSPSPEQLTRGLKVLFTLRTPFVFATSHPQPANLSIADIAQAYATGKTWPDGTPMRIILRAKQSPDTALLEQFFPALGPAMEAARHRPDVPVTAIDPDNADLAERMPGSLTPITWLQAVSEKRNLRFVMLEGVEPTLENFERGRYPYAKTLLFVLSPHAKPAAERFIAFLRSPEGQDIYHQVIGD
jgi:phosphate transport system substrate-binding protein